MIALLLARGANVDARDSGHRATPLAWVLRARMDAVITLLTGPTRDVFTLVAGGFVERLRARDAGTWR